MNEPSQSRVAQLVLANLDAAYNLARWLTRDALAAEDVVQDACVRALRFIDSQSGPNERAWFLAIVRNVCMDWLKQRRQQQVEDEYEEELHAVPAADTPADAAARASDARWVRRHIEALPPLFREVLVLRELEELSYREIGAIVDVPIGTVMSRLSRARDMLCRDLLADAERRKA